MLGRTWVGMSGLAEGAWGAAVVLAVGLAAMVGWWMVSLRLRDAGIVDLWWGPGIVLLCGTAVVVAGTAGPRIFVLVLVAAWSARLAIHLWQRNHGQPEDRRYAAWRHQHGAAWPVRSLGQVFLLQGVIGPCMGGAVVA